eukprot:TRINITY_DN4196_c0_g1_i3.p1 TRINITY_DN4196_c0_g1~~TRINITY_DN4196_c0_g1_i3.p1  ORF type:complete len:112 (-),score=14.35 TRINITY_DN4196_c0_g1_i3:67-402(-)
MAPNDNVSIVLLKELFTPLKSSTREVWRISSQDRTTVSESFYVTFTLSIESFYVLHWHQYHSYTNWMVVADFGGVAFFLYIFHTLLMSIISLCITNNSRALGGQAPGLTVS